MEKNRPPTCSLDLLDEDEQVNTMVKYATINCPTVSALLILHYFVLFNVPQFPNKIKHNYVVSFSLQETVVLETQSSLKTITTTDLETPKIQILS